MKIQNVKGGYDFLPREQEIRNIINSVIIKNFKQYGFVAIETPILCYYDILADKYDANNDILKEIYKLYDQGDRKLGLRYDLTVPFAKFIALNKNKISFPFKRFEIAKVFRDGPVRVGRDREFTQCDADIVGIEGQYVEAELLSLFVKTFRELNIDIYIKYNSRKLMTGLILEAGFSMDDVPLVTTIIDKKDKVSKDELKNMLLEITDNDLLIDYLLQIFDMSLDVLNTKFVKSNNEYIINGLEEVKNLSLYLSELNIGTICKFDSSLARGQNYYTGNVFEVYDAQNVINGSIGAGGRYDNMIPDFIGDGQKYPTVGISFGLSSIYEILKNRGDDTLSSTDIFIIPMDTKIESLKLANELRECGFSVEVEMCDKKIKKSLDYANKQKIKYVIILGSDELKSGFVKVKNMIAGTEQSISLNNIVDIILG